jgi:hypothetical protein
MTYEQWFERFGVWLDRARAPNGDFQVRPEVVHLLLERIRAAPFAWRSVFRTPYHERGTAECEVLGAFLEAARTELAAIRASGELTTYRAGPEDESFELVDPRPWYRRTFPNPG